MGNNKKQKSHFSGKELTRRPAEPQRRRRKHKNVNVTAARLSRFADLALDKSNRTLWSARKRGEKKKTEKNLTTFFSQLEHEKQGRVKACFFVPRRKRKDIVMMFARNGKTAAGLQCHWMQEKHATCHVEMSKKMFKKKIPKNKIVLRHRSNQLLKLV